MQHKIGAIAQGIKRWCDHENHWLMDYLEGNQDWSLIEQMDIAGHVYDEMGAFSWLHNSHDYESGVLLIELGIHQLWLETQGSRHYQQLTPRVNRP